MRKFKQKLAVVLLISLLLCSCSIGKKELSNENNKKINTKEAINKETDYDSKKSKSETDNEVVNNKLEKEDRLVLPEVEIDGYENKDTGDK